MRDPSYVKKSPLSRLRQLATTALPVLSLSILLACSQENRPLPSSAAPAPAPAASGNRPAVPPPDCAAAGIAFVELPVAFDGLTLVVHRANDWAGC